MVLKIRDYEAVNVFTGKGVEIGLYKKDEEYTWHIDASVKSPIRDRNINDSPIK